jgi:hypothetical protein
MPLHFFKKRRLYKLIKLTKWQAVKGSSEWVLFKPRLSPKMKWDGTDAIPS